MVGITILLFLALEGIYRLQAGIRGGPSPAAERDSTQHPYAGFRWFPELDARVARVDYRLDSYRGHWPAPLTSPYVNIDSAGRRLTISTVQDRATALRVFMLGGSSMWGFAARDSFTIPSLLASQLAQRGIQNVEVVNLAQAGHNATQGATGLLVELAHGNVPHVAVFLDGYNDIATGLRFREPGHTFAEEIAQRRLDLGKRGFWGELAGLGRHSKLVQRLLPSRPREPAARDDAAACDAIAQYYRRTHQAVEGMGAAFGVRIVRLLQPHHAATRKRLTPWEQTLGKGEIFGRCYVAIDSVMTHHEGATYFRAYDLFDSDTQTVFVDRDSHITEAANARVAELIAGILAASPLPVVHSGERVSVPAAGSAMSATPPAATATRAPRAPGSPAVE